MQGVTFRGKCQWAHRWINQLEVGLQDYTVSHLRGTAKHLPINAVAAVGVMDRKMSKKSSPFLIAVGGTDLTLSCLPLMIAVGVICSLPLCDCSLCYSGSSFL